MEKTKTILVTVLITLFVLVLIVGGIIVVGMKTASKGKSGKCEWGAGEEKYKSVSCEAYVEKDGPITIKLKNVDPKEVFLSASSAIGCSNKNGYFMCVGLMQPCQLVGNYNTSETGEFKVNCPIPWGPMKAQIDFNIGSATITWTK
jgi:hypothetical protein